MLGMRFWPGTPVPGPNPNIWVLKIFQQTIIKFLKFQMLIRIQQPHKLPVRNNIQSAEGQYCLQLVSMPLYLYIIRKRIKYSKMRRRNIKLKDYSLNGCKINCARFSRKLQPDQNRQSSRHEYFATGDNQNNIRFYEFLSEEDNELQTFNSSANNTVQSEVSAVAISWDETCIISGSSRGIINVWDVLEGKNSPICTLRGHATEVKCFGLFPGQENLIASGSSDTQIKLWDHRQKQNFATLKGHTNRVNSIQVSPDGSCLLSGSQDGTTKLWDIATQKVIYTYNEHHGPVLKVTFHPEDRMFASCSSDRTAKYFSCDVSKKVYQFISSTELVSMPITAIDFSPDGSLLCTGANDTLKIWHMRKGGLIIESIDSAWKGVQDLIWSENGIKGISSNAGVLSVWFCYLADKRAPQQKQKQEEQLKLPKIFKNPSMRKEISNPPEERKIRPAEGYNSNKQIDQNPKILDRNRDLEQVMNNVNLALGNLNNVAELKNRQKQEAKKQQQRQRKQQERIKDEQRKQRIRVQKEKQKQQKQAKQRQRRERIQKEKQEQERKMQQKIELLEKQRLERQKLLQQKLHETFQRNNNLNYEMTVEHDTLENSSVMNISTFMGNGAQKEKLQQIELIGQFMKESGRFESIYKMRSSYVKPIIHYWKQGKIDSALYTLSQADIAVAFDCISAVLHNSTFKMGITPDVACALLKKLVEIMHNKHSTYVKNSMLYLNEIVLMFKDELIKVKMFNPMTRVDLSREERLAKYDRLTEQFLNVFKQDRLKKYALQNKASDNDELHNIAAELYKNLEEVLRKIMPRKDAEPA